jgi:murein DD-endopeptidase MepM/ murein hydrolase activator NlpD
MLGIAALAISAGGAVTAGDPALAGSGTHDKGVAAANALNGTGASASTDLLNDRRAAVSRDSRRDALEDAAQAALEAAMEKRAQQRNAALALLAQQAEQRAAQLAANRWVLPVDSVEITAEFGEYGLWASYHTGLDFNGNSGDPIYSIASGVVTSVGYDGAYGNKTVVTLDDGTEIWYAHQTSMLVSEGEAVAAGEQIGTIGATGNVTGSHLHLEVRPGGGDPVDPYAAMLVHGIDF